MRSTRTALRMTLVMGAGLFAAPRFEPVKPLKAWVPRHLATRQLSITRHSLAGVSSGATGGTEMGRSHQNRIHASVSAFQSASEDLIGALERLNDEVAKRVPQDGGWNAAQIGYHVAITNDFLAGILTGAIPSAVPAPAGFAENAEIFKNVPARIETFPQLVPPPNVTRTDAIEKLRQSTGMTVQAIESLTADRAAGYCVQFPVGQLSMYQVADFIGGHVVRHQKQLQRATQGV